MKNTHKRGFHFTRKGWITIAAVLVIAAAALAMILTQTNTANPDLYVDYEAASDPIIPNQDGLRATRHDLSTAEAAQDYFQQLLDSEYIGLCGDAGFPAELTDGKWHMREENADGTALTAVFDPEGVITSLSIGTNLRGELQLQPSGDPYRFNSGDVDLYEYVRAFTYEYLPDIQIISGFAAAEQSNEEGRFVTYHTSNGYVQEPTHEFIVQIEPAMRIVGFRLLVDEAKGVIRSSGRVEAETAPETPAKTAAKPGAAPPTEDEIIAVALRALIDVYTIPEDEAKAYQVDTRFYDNYSDVWCGYETTAPYWRIGFIIPDSDPDAHTEYDVLVDAATGAVLQIFDPSNNTNG